MTLPQPPLLVDEIISLAAVLERGRRSLLDGLGVHESDSPLQNFKLADRWRRRPRGQ
jgi:hypothetical protein